MSSPNILFILGAGASIPYNFPTGMQLREKIINEYLPLLAWLQHDIDDDKDFNFFLKTFKESPDEIIKILKSNYTAVSSLPFYNSFRLAFGSTIDRFITGTGKQFVDEGRFAIASTLLKYEKESFLHSIPVLQDDWMKFLFHDVILKNVFQESDFPRLFDFKINFLTFNYDRTLEYYITQLFANQFKPRNSTLGQILNHFKVHHIYGQVGNQFDYQDHKLRFGYLDDLGYIYNASKNINIIYPDRDKDEKAIELISQANVIFILGFGFDPFNLKIIDFPESFKGKVVFATRYKMAYNDRIRVTRLVEGKIKQFAFEDILPVELLQKNSDSFNE